MLPMAMSLSRPSLRPPTIASKWDKRHLWVGGFCPSSPILAFNNLFFTDNGAAAEVVVDPAVVELAAPATSCNLRPISIALSSKPAGEAGVTPDGPAGPRWLPSHWVRCSSQWGAVGVQLLADDFLQELFIGILHLWSKRSRA